MTGRDGHGIHCGAVGEASWSHIASISPGVNEIFLAVAGVFRPWHLSSVELRRVSDRIIRTSCHDGPGSQLIRS